MSDPVHLNGKFLTQRLTGVQRHARELVLALDRLAGERNGRPLRLLVPSAGLAEAERLGLRRTSVQVVGRADGQRWEQWELARFAAGKALAGFCNVGPAWLRRQLVIVHDAAALDHPEWFGPGFRWWYRWLLPRLLRRARMVVTDSNFSRQRLEAYARGRTERPIEVVYSAAGSQFRPPPAALRAEARTALQLPERYLLAVGSLDPRKNLGVLLQAWTLLAPKFPEVELLVAGAGSSVFADPRLPPGIPRLRFLGYVDDRLLPALYAEAAGLVYPSRYEGFGLPPLEAMASGCPVVVARAASLPEVCGEAALYGDPDQAETFAGPMATLLDQPAEAERMRAAGLQQAGGFDWVRSAAQLWDLLQEL